MKTHNLLSGIIIFLVFTLLIVQGTATEEMVIVDFYYSESCGSCRVPHEIMQDIKQRYETNYSGKIIINIKNVDVKADEYSINKTEMQARGLSYPSAIINNETKIPKENITQEKLQNLEKLLNEYIAKLPNQTIEPNNIPLVLAVAMCVSLCILAAVVYKQQKKKK
ncbi:MAG: hypothetical protein NT038_01465 [Euryarchaeota archaeon]|nr:hypothetical protein [Euryarchaeota archaeon]